MTHDLATRREFLTAGGAAAGALAKPQRRILGANDRINVAVIGTGLRGTSLMSLVLKRAQDKADVQVIAVCDVYQRRLSRAASIAKDARQYVYYQELLQMPDVDAVFIATPDHWHAPITLSAFERGLDVYCEKPMSLAVEDAITVAHRAAQLKRILQIGVQSMSWANWHKAKESIESGFLGPVVSCHGTLSRNVPGGDWNWPISAADSEAGPNASGEDHIEWKQWLGPAPKRPFVADRFFHFRKYWDYSGGIATDLHYHIVAPFHLAVRNDYPTRVVGMGGIWRHNDGREVPDTFLNAADYPGKYSILIQSSQANATGPQTMIRGEQATMFLSDRYGERQTDYIRIVPEKPFAKKLREKWQKDEIIIPGVGNEGSTKHVDNFFDCVRSRQQPVCNADLSAKVMVHIGLSVRSYREGKMFYFDSKHETVSDHRIA